MRADFEPRFWHAVLYGDVDMQSESDQQVGREVASFLQAQCEPLPRLQPPARNLRRDLRKTLRLAGLEHSGATLVSGRQVARSVRRLKEELPPWNWRPVEASLKGALRLWPSRDDGYRPLAGGLLRNALASSPGAWEDPDRYVRVTEAVEGLVVALTSSSIDGWCALDYPARIWEGEARLAFAELLIHGAHYVADRAEGRGDAEMLRSWEAVSGLLRLFREGNFPVGQHVVGGKVAFIVLTE